MTITRVIFIWIFLIPLISWSQVNDAGLWTGISVKKEIINDLSADMELETRFDENLAELNSAFVDLGLTYKVISQVRVSAAYRFGNRRGTDNLYSLRQRVAFDLSMKEKWKGYEVSYRARYQVGQSNFQSEERINDISSAIRHKVGLEKKVLKRTFLDLSCEWFTEQQDQLTVLTDMRYTAMLQRRLKKRKYLNLGYTIQREYNAVNPWTEYILRIGYKLELK